jgi:hypothetical protein
MLQHGIYCYFGKLGQGKTYAMTSDVIEYLNQGNVVYANYHIDWKGFSVKPSVLTLYAYYFLGKSYDQVFYPPTNFRYVETDEKFMSFFAQQGNAIFAIDEAYMLFDSYLSNKMSLKDRASVLQCRKYSRTLLYTTQRPESVHVTLRSMTNIFYACDRINLPLLGLIFRRREYEMQNDMIDTSQKPVYTKVYRFNSGVAASYDTKQLIGIKGVVAENKAGVELRHFQSPYVRLKKKLQTGKFKSWFERSLPSK